MQKKEYLQTGVLTSILLCLLIVGCGPFGDEQASTSSALTTTAETEWTIPANFTTYTDESGVFSISYPSDWEVDISVLADHEASVKDLIELIDPEMPLEQALTVFIAGVPCGIDCYHPGVNIVMEPLTPNSTSIEADMEEVINNIKVGTVDFHEISRETAIINSREAVILESEASTEGVETTAHFLQMFTNVDDMGWAVTCGLLTELADYTEYEDDFQNVIRSLKLH